MVRGLDSASFFFAQYLGRKYFAYELHKKHRSQPARADSAVVCS